MKIIDIKPLNIQPEDIIVVHVDTNKFNCEEIEKIHYLLKSHLKNAIITFPNGIDIQPQDWKTVYDYIISIKPEGVKNKK